MKYSGLPVLSDAAIFAPRNIEKLLMGYRTTSEQGKKEIAFDKIRDHNEKILLTMDYETGSRNGVKQMNAIDWLLENLK